MIQDTYSSLDLSQWTEHLSRSLLLSKIGSSLCLAKLPKLQSFRKRPFCNGGCNTLSKIVFLSSFSFIFVALISQAGFPTVGLSSKWRLQHGVVLSQANISWSGPLVQVMPHWNIGVIIDSLSGHISHKSFTRTFYPEFLFIPHAQWENYLTSLFSTCKDEILVKLQNTLPPMALHVIEYK